MLPQKSIYFYLTKVKDFKPVKKLFVYIQCVKGAKIELFNYNIKKIEKTKQNDYLVQFFEYIVIENFPTLIYNINTVASFARYTYFIIGDVAQLVRALP